MGLNPHHDMIWSHYSIEHNSKSWILGFDNGVKPLHGGDCESLNGSTSEVGG